MKVECAIIGGGIVGLSVAFHLLQRQPGLRGMVLEKEPQLASHQTGRNSGVIHSGIYYAPGSLKAGFARQGNRSMIAFCEQHSIAHEVCGKVVVATAEKELSLLEDLYQRGLENRLEVVRLSGEQVREIEPHVRCLRGLRVPSTAIVNYRQVCARLADSILDLGGTVQTATEVRSITQRGDLHFLLTTGREVEARYLINCGGLQSDRLARKAGVPVEGLITPFRGE